MASILVTGAAGFIGSHLCERLIRDGHSVTAIDNFDDFYDPAVKRENLSAIVDHRRFRLIEIDIRDERLVREAVTSDIQVIVHLAARAGVRPSIEQPLLYQDVNVRGTLTMLEASRARHRRKFIFGSSSSVYGNNEKTPFSESDAVDRPISPYAATKRAGEILCSTYHDLYGVPTTCLRFFTVYGPRQRPDLAIHKFARRIESGRPVPVFGDGTLARDFTYIDDIIDGVVRAIDRCDGFRIYNVGNAHPVRVDELVGRLERALRKRAIVEHLPQPPGDVVRTCADISRAQEELGYSPKTDLETGLREFVSWFRDRSRIVAQKSQPRESLSPARAPVPASALALGRAVALESGPPDGH